jgi:K+-sensing histidine kinase KdpD
VRVRDHVGVRAPVGLRPVPGGAAGLAGVVLIAGILVLVPRVTRAGEALALVVPVVVAAVLGGRAAAYVVALVATLAFVLLVPPLGSVRVNLTEDLVALAVFLVVAVVVGTLVSGRINLLSQVDRQRVALLRSVSHDLRTPLAAIRAAASDLASGEVGDPADRQELLEIVSAEAERLDRLVGNLLSLGRIEAGFLRLQLVEEAAGGLGTVLSRIPVEIRVPDDLPSIQADHALTQQVITNLLENASRHSAPGCPVVIEAGPRDGHVEIAVVDQGPGIDAAMRSHLFEPFRSGSSPGASGIGLAICKAIVEAHGGTISVSDEDEPGSRFTVRFPAR